MVTRMAGFDVAAGMYKSALNALLMQLYNALYPNFLKENINVGEVGISYVDFNIQGPPTVSLALSADAKAHIAAAFETLYNAQLAKAGAKAMAISDKSAILDIVSSVTFTVNVSKLARRSTTRMAHRLQRSHPPPCLSTPWSQWMPPSPI